MLMLAAKTNTLLGEERRHDCSPTRYDQQLSDLDFSCPKFTVGLSVGQYSVGHPKPTKCFQENVKSFGLEYNFWNCFGAIMDETKKKFHKSL